MIELLFFVLGLVIGVLCGLTFICINYSNKLITKKEKVEPPCVRKL